MDVQDAVTVVRCCRPIAQPNPSFMEQLNAWSGLQRQTPGHVNTEPSSHRPSMLGAVTYRTRDGRTFKADIVASSNDSPWASRIDIVTAAAQFSGVDGWLRHVRMDHVGVSHHPAFACCLALAMCEVCAAPVGKPLLLQVHARESS